MSGINWAKGVGYSIVASLIGGASKLAIRKSWLMVEKRINNQNQHQHQHQHENQHESLDQSSSSSNCDYENGDSIIVDGSARNGVSPGHGAGRLQTEMGYYRANDGNDNANGNGNGNDSDSDFPVIVNHHLNLNQHSATQKKNVCSTGNIALGLRFSGMIGMTFLNPLFCVLAMNYASPSILAPFSGLTLVWIVLFSETMIGEKPQRKQIIAAFLIIVGEVIVAIFGDHTNDEDVTLEDVEESYRNPYFLFFFAAMFAWFAGLIYIIFTKSSSPVLRRFAFGVAGGSLTGFQNFLKDSLTIIKAVGEEDAYPYYFYIFVVMAMASSFGGLLFLTACMKEYDATFSSAMFVGSFVISASIMSAVHYQTFQHLVGIWNWIMYPVGLIILMIGVDLLVKATAEPETEFDMNGIVVPESRSTSPNSREQRHSLLENTSTTSTPDDVSAAIALGTTRTID
jgi:drug/metabolite transporter (DMT)-like permease